MENCSKQCLRRTLYAVLIGISPIVICLLLIGFVRIILHCLELIFCRHIKADERRRSSTSFYQSGRPTLLYTPVSVSELQRIIQGDYQNQQPTDALLPVPNNDNDVYRTPKFMKSILSKHDPPGPPAPGAIANLIGRRNAINAIPFTALLVPVSTPSTPNINTINEKQTRRPSRTSITDETSETEKLNPTNQNDNRLNRNNSMDSKLSNSRPLYLTRTRTLSMAGSLVLEEEAREFYSATSIPHIFN